MWAEEWRWSACCSGRSMLRPYEESRRRGVGRKSALCPVEGRRVPHMDVWLGDGDVWMREALWRQWVDAGRTGTRSALRWCEGGVTAHVKGPRSKDLGYINGRVKRAGETPALRKAGRRQYFAGLPSTCAGPSPATTHGTQRARMLSSPYGEKCRLKSGSVGCATAGAACCAPTERVVGGIFRGGGWQERASETTAVEDE